MSASRCFRCALDVARPAKRLNISPKPLVQTRYYADVPTSTKPQRAGSETITNIPKSQRSNREVESIKDAPAKRAPPPVSQPISKGVVKPDATPPAPEEAITSPENIIQPKPIPPNVAAAYRTPFRHDFKDGVPVASLQLRSYSIRNLEFFADFAMRVAYYLKLPASGPAPLPKKIERWTVPRSNFVHKKSQENFERITLRRLITVFDGHPDVVEVWLACLRKWQFYGVGMKANVWQFESLDVASKLDKQAQDIEKELDAKLANFGWHNNAAGKKSIEEMLRRQGGNVAGSPMSSIRDEISDAKYMDLHRDVQ